MMGNTPQDFFVVSQDFSTPISIIIFMCLRLAGLLMSKITLGTSQQNGAILKVPLDWLAKIQDESQSNTNKSLRKVIEDWLTLM